MAHYNSLLDLLVEVPDRFPKGAQEIYKESYDRAWDGYENSEVSQGSKSRESIARRAAWDAVKDEYEKDNNGKWHKKR